MRTQIVINNTQIDLLKDVSLNITKQLVDIQSPEKRKTDRTLTIEIPGSKENDKLFSYIFEVNIDLGADDSTQEAPHFNPNKKAPVTIFIDNFQQLKGYCQLTDIVVEHRDMVTYKIVCFGEIGDLFAKIDNQKNSEGETLKGELTDIDLSEFDHEYTRYNIANSWNTEIIQNGSPTAFALGKGYVYPMIDYGYQKNYVSGTKTDQWGVEQFRPAVYAKQYVDKIFENAGYTYTSTFFNSDLFKRLIVPFNSEQFILTKEEVDARLFYANRTTNYESSFVYNAGNLSAANAILFDDDSAPFFDNGNNYNTSTGKFVCPANGRYSFYAQVIAKLKYDDGSYKIVRDSSFPTVRVTLVLIRKRGSSYDILATGYGWPYFNPGDITSGEVSSTFGVSIKKDTAYLKTGDEVFVAALDVYAVLNHIDTTGSLISGWTLDIQVPNTYFSNGLADSKIGEGDTLPINKCIPTGVKQRDFIGSIIKAFNLYVEPNPDVENDLIIEPRADYYTGQFTDWTHKLDISKEFTISPMAALDAGEYQFTYKEDGDYLNKHHKDHYDYIYGSHTEKIDNDFVKGSKKVELVFAPTPLFREDDDPTERVIPYIAFVDSKGIVSTKSSKIRLLYYGGLKDCETWNFLENSSPYVFTQYPYSGHLNDPFDSTFDLNFAPPYQIYYKTTANKPIEYTSLNLYTKYWSAQIKEITDKNSKLVEGWFYLTPADIQGLSFRKYYFIKDAYYRLLKVENYDPVFSKTTKCQFLKVQEFDAPLQVRTRVNGGRGTFGTAGTTYNVPTIGGTAAPVGSPVSGPRVVTGWSNTVDPTTLSVLLTGVGNNILGSSERITVIGGGGNLIGHGLQDVTLINSSGITVAEPGVLYLNNQQYHTTIMGSAQTIAVENSPYTLTTAVRTLFCNAADGEITVNLPAAEGNNGKIFEIIKTDATGNTVFIDPNGAETINGALSQTLLLQYDKTTLVCNGTEWFKL